MSMLEPKILICTSCREEFVLRVGEQKAASLRSTVERPTRCRDCQAIENPATVIPGHKSISRVWLFPDTA